MLSVASMSVSLIDLEGHFGFWNFETPIPGEIVKHTWPVNSTDLWKLKDSELNVTGRSHTQKDNISETV